MIFIKFAPPGASGGRGRRGFRLRHAFGLILRVRTFPTQDGSRSQEFLPENLHLALAKIATLGETSPGEIALENCCHDLS